MYRITYPILFLLFLCSSVGCRKIDLKSPSRFVKLFPDSSYQTGGGFQLPDGNYIIYGFDPDESGVLPRIIKTDGYGNIIWQIELSSLFHFFTVKPTLDGKMLAVGVVDETSMNFCLIDADGDTSMLPSYIDSVRATPNLLPDFVCEPDGYFSVSGYFDSARHFFPFVLRINQNGDSYKKHIILNSLLESSNFSPVTITHRVNGYSVTGMAADNDHPFKGMFYVRLDDLYNVVGESVIFDESATLTAEWMTEDSSDNSTIICGETGSDYSGNLYVRRIDANNSVGEKNVITGDFENFGKFKHIRNTTGGGYILAGTVNILQDLNLVSYSKIYLLKLDHDFNKEWSREFGTINPYAGISASQTTDGGYMICGFERHASYVFTMLLIKTDANGNIVSE